MSVSFSSPQTKSSMSKSQESTLDSCNSLLAVREYLAHLEDQGDRARQASSNVERLERSDRALDDIGKLIGKLSQDDTDLLHAVQQDVECRLSTALIMSHWALALAKTQLEVADSLSKLLEDGPNITLSHTKS